MNGKTKFICISNQEKKEKFIRDYYFNIKEIKTFDVQESGYTNIELYNGKEFKGVMESTDGTDVLDEFLQFVQDDESLLCLNYVEFEEGHEYTWNTKIGKWEKTNKG